MGQGLFLRAGAILLNVFWVDCPRAAGIDANPEVLSARKQTFPKFMILVKPKGKDGKMVHHWVEKAVKESWLTGKSNFPKEKGGLGKSRLSWLFDSISYENHWFNCLLTCTEQPCLMWPQWARQWWDFHITAHVWGWDIAHRNFCLESGSVGAGEHGGSLLKYE